MWGFITGVRRRFLGESPRGFRTLRDPRGPHRPGASATSPGPQDSPGPPGIKPSLRTSGIWSLRASSGLPEFKTFRALGALGSPRSLGTSGASGSLKSPGIPRSLRTLRDLPEAAGPKDPPRTSGISLGTSGPRPSRDLPGPPGPLPEDLRDLLGDLGFSALQGSLRAPRATPRGLQGLPRGRPLGVFDTYFGRVRIKFFL